MRKLLQCKDKLLLLFFWLPVLVFGQDKAITGTVLSDDNTPLPGATITVRGTNRSVTTNASGVFTITAANNAVLVITYIGFEEQTVRVGNSTTLTITLRASRSSLGEVVVTAYGIRREKKSLGYSTQVVDGEDIANTRRENFINSLAGRVAGATITPSSGVPGASSQIVLRGATSIGGNNQPLFVVDGIPYDNQTLNQENLVGGTVSFANRNSDYGNRAMDINPDDIENVTILKGPEASALYGADGASGAIVITTRKGRSGKASVSYDNSFRVENVYRFPEVQKMYTLGNNGIYDPNAITNPFSVLGTATGAGIPAAFGPRIEPGTATFNNAENFFQNGFTQQHNLNVEGGSDIATYRFSTNYTDQTGVVPNTGFEKFSARLMGSTKIGNKLRLTTSMNYVTNTTMKASKGAGGYLLTLLTWPTTSDVRSFQKPDGSKIPLRNITNYSLEYDNPLWDVYKNPGMDKVDRLTGNLNLSYDVTSWLNLGAVTGIDYYTQYGTLAVHPLSRFGVAGNGFYSLYQQTTRNFSNTLKATATKKFGDFSNSFTVGFYTENNLTKVESQKGERFYERDFLGINNTDPLSRDARTAISQVRKVRFFGNYILGYKYVYLSLAGSREGSSTFMSKVVDKDPFFNYGSSSLSFVASDIPAIKEALPWLNLAKGRISFATTGKSPSAPYIIDYRFTSQITTGGGFAYDVTGNNFDLVPERSNNLEYGAEFSLFKGRLRMDIARYHLLSRNQILAARASYGTGFVIKWFNGGEVENKGIEVQLAGTPVESKDFRWETIINFDRNVGTVKSMPASLPTYYDSDTWVFGNLRSQYFPGAKIGNMAANTISRNNKGQVLISPTSGLPVRNNDFLTVGDRQPDFKLGWVNSIRYKQFDLSFNIDFRKGGDVFNATEYFLYLTGYSVKTLDRDKPRVIEGVLQDGFENTANPTKNTISVTPMYNSAFYSSTTAATEEDFVENVNWARLRDVTLRYTFPARLLSGVKFIKSASIYFTGTDLLMITNYSGADPAVNANTASNRGFGGAGIDYGALSIPRGFNFGCAIKF
jgi:ferric enterobactin receptor